MGAVRAAESSVRRRARWAGESVVGYLLDDIFCETTIHGDPARVEILAENRFTPSAVKTIIALISQASREPLACLRRAEDTYGNAYVGDDAVAEVETLDILAHLDDFSDGFMSRNELNQRVKVSSV